MQKKLKKVLKVAYVALQLYQTSDTMFTERGENLKARIRLKELLLKNNVSINKLSKETGISRSTLKRWYDKPIGKVEIDKLNKVCNYFDCNIKDFIEFVENEEKAGA